MEANRQRAAARRLRLRDEHRARRRARIGRRRAARGRRPAVACDPDRTARPGMVDLNGGKSSMKGSVRSKLFVMMVLEFFVWGAWYPLIFGYLPSLGFTPAEQSWILTC